MAKFEESKVISPLHTENAEIGKKYWVSDELGNLKDEVEKEKAPYELKRIEKGCFYPFVINLLDEEFQFLYPYEEPPKQRMTRIQFIEWVNKGNGIYKYKNGSGNCYTSKLCEEKELNEEVDRNIVIRTWDSEEWVEPTVDIYERDCKGGK